MTEPLEQFGKKLTSKALKDENLRTDLTFIINSYAWPQGEKIVKELLKLYLIERKPITPKKKPVEKPTAPAHATEPGESTL